MSEPAVTRALVAAVVVNMVLVVVLWRGSTPTAVSPPLPSSAPSTAAVPSPPPLAAVGGPPAGMSNPGPNAPPGAFNAPLPDSITLDELYWGITRYEDERSLHSAQDEAQAARVVEVLRQARDGGWDAAREKAAVLKSLPMSMQGQIAFWHAKAAEWPMAARHAMFATRDDAIDVLEHPPATDSRTSSRGDPDKSPRLTVGFDFVLWGLLGLEKSDMPLSKAQARVVAQVLDSLPEHQQKLDACSAGLYEVAEKVLTAPQKQYIAAHQERIETYSLRYQMAVPLDADVIGYVCLRLMAHRAGTGFRKVEVPQLSQIDPRSFENRMKSGEYSAGILLLEEDPQLKITAEQARAMMGYVKGIADYNFAWHMAKEQIGDLLTKKQRTWIMDRIAQGQIGGGTLADLNGVAHMFREKGQ